MARKLGEGMTITEMAITPTQSPTGLIAKYFEEVEAARRLGHSWSAISEGLARSAGLPQAIPVTVLRQTYSRYKRSLEPNRPSIAKRAAAALARPAAQRPATEGRSQTQTPPPTDDGGINPKIKFAVSGAPLTD